MGELPTNVEVIGEEHWTTKGDIKLFLWEKYAGRPDGKKGTVLFVHGSSMASQPTFDLEVEGNPCIWITETRVARHTRTEPS